jgi:hypothetical protein
VPPYIALRFGACASALRCQDWKDSPAPFPISNFDAATQATVELLPETKGTTHLLDLGTVYNYARSNSVLSPADMIKRDRIRNLLNF